MNYRLASVPFLLAATLLALPARADIPPPETEPCQGKAVGDACVYGDSGAKICQTWTCSKLDYAHWDRDASSGPPTTTYACVECLSSTNTNTNTTTDTNTDTHTNTVTATNTNTNTNTDDSACSIGKHATAKRVAPWLLAGAFSLLFVAARRRRQD